MEHVRGIATPCSSQEAGQTYFDLFLDELDRNGSSISRVNDHGEQSLTSLHRELSLLHVENASRPHVAGLVRHMPWQTT